MSFSDDLQNTFIIKRILSILGIDKPVFYTILTVFWSSIAGIVSIVFIVDFLSLSDQGYWYTFLSLGALATFAELGFTTIITQFISHEYAHLEERNGKLFGEDNRIDRTISLVRFSFKFYIVITIVAFIILSIVGVIFLMNTTNDIYLLVAWVFYSFTGAFMLLVSLFGAVLRGFNKVSVAQKIIFLTNFASNIAIWAALYVGFNLWALGIGGIINIILSLFLFFSSSTSLWSQIFRSKITGKYYWLKETLPLQWRYAISWASGYFIFQFIIPVALIYAGADVAGKLGLSLVIARAVQTLANSWGLTKIPQFNMFVAQKKRDKLDNLLNYYPKTKFINIYRGFDSITLNNNFNFPYNTMGYIGFSQLMKLPSY